MNNENYINPTEIRKQFSITSNTLRRWADQGKIRSIRPNGTRRLYNSADIKQFFGVSELRISEKISNLVLDMHKKLSKWLCENYTKVYIPKLNFHNMRRLHRKEKSKLASLSHCAFVDRLIWKSREYKCDIYEVQEEYTSKTCSSCGFLKKELKGRTFKCDACNKIFDRDVNASKNIMLKYLTNRAIV